jgi:hypothetical protein
VTQLTFRGVPIVWDNQEIPMPRGVYKRKDPKKLSRKEAEKLKAAASVTDQLKNGAAEGAVKNFSFEAPARPWRQHLSIIQEGPNPPVYSMLGTSELSGEIVERLKANNPKATRITVLRINIEETSVWSKDEDHF